MSPLEYAMALVRPPGKTFADGLTEAGLGPPNLGRALEQHAAYVQALRLSGIRILELPADDHYPDSTFVEDCAVTHGDTVVLTRPGHPSRRGEVPAIEKALSPFFGRMERIEAPGMLDGGDVCDLGNRCLVGLSARSNEEGVRQLALILARRDVVTEAVDLSQYPGLLHLKSGVTFIGFETVVAIPALAGHPLLKGFDVVITDRGEEYGANCVGLPNDGGVLCAAGHPKLFESLVDRGFAPLALDMLEFHRMDGALTCLSLRFGAHDED